MNTKIWLSSPHMGGNEQKYINEAFAENWVAPLGPNVNQFEESIKTYLGQSVDVAALSAGTAALHLALIILGVKMGDEVICQSMTFSASANPIAYQGATPVFIDSEKETWNMCPLALEDAIKERLSKGKKLKAIIVVHLYGMPAKMDELMAVASKYEIPIIEDAAEALGSSYKGQKCGTFGEMSILSFNGNKIITTSGGGALLCQTSAQKEKAVFLSTQARDNAPHYQHSEIGYNYRMSNICAGIGCGQMEVLDERISQRRANHQFYIDLFKNIEGVEVFTEPSEDYFSNHWLSAIVIDPQKAGFSREDLRLKFLEDNIESRPLWKPMHLQPVFADTPYYGGQVAQQLFENGLCLPSGSNLTDADRQRISEVVYKLKS
ncbi:aminotransferase class I/II-fold pyridoxal phosphate-dependent enzyme [Riemerella anatipestifer]|uniref:aminotransferase class I/II-fold pyridoxal phosphate-dependent enzyme n=1 Tax=Riemerella anatipestifer TaxID=34085 RepID=UPI00208E0717|nr:aminotransferase class I/II-fold pyridoxal phosphate-dependent enzyme [Riemerella anatipestifer]MCO4303058.1 aminotransferase class I/II-fold pyridoxal phosphate-dependent enzyme [Riemerella anatipestifer]MCO7353189.1 aminotransferase class I/II-fold pyridoxal phosphate-dependent enzyme [Riemerella anatipestifer]MCQ4038564.1 aminotransferase class I/II-fold pyridoxal phosphate-dependent enzyme [Riemerella anatipestifer]MCT6760107.1 aminotransferase class I/II-fold pyridoxal phosphate-depende